MPRAILATLLCTVAFGQPPPKCAPRSLDSTCDSFAGAWTGLLNSNTPLLDEYSLSLASPPAPVGAFVCAMVHTSGPSWSNCTGLLARDNSTVNITFNTGLAMSGIVAPGCQTIVWDNGSIWQRYVQLPIRIHVVPHTHDDVGWNKNLQQYFDGSGPAEYGQNVTAILGSVIPALAANASRRFSYVEQAYFTMWLESQTPETKALVRQLVASRQLVFLNGGYSMHDEAGPTYVDMSVSMRLADVPIDVLPHLLQA